MKQKVTEDLDGVCPWAPHVAGIFRRYLAWGGMLVAGVLQNYESLSEKEFIAFLALES